MRRADFARLLIRATKCDGEDNATVFADEMHEFLIDEGIAWQLANGKIVTRGTEAFEALVTEATTALETSQRPRS